MNILIVKLGAIGDVVNSLPFVNRLRAGRPEARITWLIGPTAHALVSGHRAVDEFIVADLKRARAWPGIVRALRSRKFDLAIDLQRILKSGALVRASGAPERLGFDVARCKEGSHVFTNRKIAPNPSPGVTVEQYLEFDDFLDCPPQTPRFDLPFEPYPTPPPSELRVIVNVGATKSANRWYTPKWIDLSQRLVRELGATVHLTGGNVDAAETRAIVAGAALRDGAIVDHAGKLSLKASAGLIASARLFIGCDTGPLHVAVAVNTPVVALFGASDPRRTGPFGQLEHVVTHPVPCSPCRRRTCNVDGHPCMRDLDVELVLERARARLPASARGI
jgi:ADP-heptose:LPS heptosyltransferase